MQPGSVSPSVEVERQQQPSALHELLRRQEVLVLEAGAQEALRMINQLKVLLTKDIAANPPGIARWIEQLGWSLVSTNYYCTNQRFRCT